MRLQDNGGLAMAIGFHCKCGRPLRASLDAAGKRTKCPGCGQILTIPSQSTPESAAPVPQIAGAPAAPATEADPLALTIDWPPADLPRAETDLHRSSGAAIIKVDAAVADGPSQLEVPRTEDGSLQYRVLTQKDQGFAGKFSATKLEEMLNAHARQGWCLKSAVTIQIPGHGGHHDELIVILER